MKGAQDSVSLSSWMTWVMLLTLGCKKAEWKMKGTAQNQEQADSSGQLGAEHLPKVKPQELVIDTCAQAQRIISPSLRIQYLSPLLPLKKHLAAVFKFNQIFRLCSFTDCKEKWITGPRRRANSSGSDCFKPYLTYQVSLLTVPLGGISYMDLESLSQFFHFASDLQSGFCPLLM